MIGPCLPVRDAEFVGVPSLIIGGETKRVGLAESDICAQISPRRCVPGLHEGLQQ
jgi:hypothetical protein